MSPAYLHKRYGDHYPQMQYGRVFPTAMLGGHRTSFSARLSGYKPRFPATAPNWAATCASSRMGPVTERHTVDRHHLRPTSGPAPVGLACWSLMGRWSRFLSREHPAATGTSCWRWLATCMCVRSGRHYTARARALITILAGYRSRMRRLLPARPGPGR